MEFLQYLLLTDYPFSQLCSLGICRRFPIPWQLGRCPFRTTTALGPNRFPVASSDRLRLFCRIIPQSVTPIILGPRVVRIRRDSSVSSFIDRHNCCAAETHVVL